MSISDINKVYLSDTAAVIKFIDGIESRTELKINSSSNTNAMVYLFLTKTGTGQIFLIAKERLDGIPNSIKLDINDLVNNSYQIESLERIVYKSTLDKAQHKTEQSVHSPQESVTESPIEDERNQKSPDEDAQKSKFEDSDISSSASQGNIQSDDPVVSQDDSPVEFEEDEETIYINKTSWELNYTRDELKDSYVSQVQNYNITEGIKSNIDNLNREADSILDLIEKYSTTNDIFNKETVSYLADYKPLYNKILNGNFNNCYIIPIIHDKKKYYKNGDLEDTNSQVISISQRDETAILLALQEKMYRQQNAGVSDLSYKKMLKLLYEGGTSSINISNIKDLPEEDIIHNSIYRTHINDSSDIKGHYYSYNLKKNTTVYRDCFIDNCINNPEIDEDSDIHIKFSKRIADGELNIQEDVYDEQFNIEKGTMETCNSHGDKLYSSSIDDIDKNKTMNRSPYYNKYIDGEEVNIVGFYIKSPDNMDISVINGTEEIIDNGSVKYYSNITSKGLSVLDSSSFKKSKNLVIHNNYSDFDWNNYENDTDYVVMIDTTSKKKINKEQYEEVISHISPTIHDIFELEKVNLEKVTNLLDISLILNKHGVFINQVPSEIFIEYNISANIISNIIQLNNYEKFLKKKYTNSHIEYNIFNNINDSILKFKLICELKLKDSTYKVPDNDLKLKVKEFLNDNLSKNLLQYDNNIITKYINIFLNIETEPECSRDEMLEIITDTFIKNDNFYVSKFNKYFIDKKQLIHPVYQDLFDSFMKEYNYDYNTFNETKLTHFDKNILQNIHFVNSIKKSDNGGNELLSIINLSNMKNMEEIIHNIIDNRGYIEYNKTKKQVKWDNLSDSDKIKYLPSIKLVKQLNEQAAAILTIYNSERKIMKNYQNNCKNLPIVKEYFSKEILFADNDRNIYLDDKFDTFHNDLKLYNSILNDKDNELDDVEEEGINEEILGLFKERLYETYIYNSIESIDKKFNIIEEYLITPNTKKGTLIKQGDLAILHIEDRRELYRRQGSKWLPVLEKLGINSCINYDNKLFDIDFQDIKDNCLNIEDLDNNDCIEDNNKILSNKMYKLYKHHQSLIDDISNIIKVLDYKKQFETYMEQGKEKLQDKLKIIQSKNDRKSRELVRLDESSINTNIYPPKYIQDKLNNIRKIDDFDMMGQQLIEFIATYGSSSKGVEYNKPYLIYYNIPNVNVPLICKHHELLLTSVLKDNTTKERILKEVCEEYGVSGSETIYCKYCGEIIDFHKYSEWEGFGNDNKIINVREIVDNKINEQDLLSDEKYEIISMILNICNINLRNDDLKIIMILVEQLSKNKLSFENFYFTLIKKSNTKDVSLVKKDAYIKVEEWFNNKYNNYTIEFWDNIESDEVIMNDIKSVKNGTKLISAFKKWIKLYKGYQNAYDVNCIVACLSEIIRTSLPEYIIKGTGTEKASFKKGNMSGLLLRNIYTERVTINDTETYWVYAYFIDLVWNQIKQKASNFWKWCNHYYKGIFTNMEESYRENVIELLEDIVEIVTIKDRQSMKDLYNMNLLIESTDVKQYDWKEFLPSLDFNNNNYSYQPPNINSKISKFHTNLNELERLNINLKEQHSDSLERSIREKAVILKDLLKELEEIESRLSVNIINKINNIITNEEIPNNLNPSIYISSCCFNNIKNDYLKYYLDKDSSISNDVENLNKIRIFFSKTQLNNNIIYDVSTTTHPVRDLQHFMTFDESLYKNEQELRTVLIDKLKQINYIYVIENYGLKKQIDNSSNELFMNNIGKLRSFKEITDKDSNMLFDLYQSDKDLDIDTASILHQKLIDTYGDNYQFVDFKLKLINEYNGKADIDMITGEFKQDISNVIDTETTHLDIGQIKEIINLIELQSNNNIDITDNYNITFHNKLNNLDMIQQKLFDTINSHCCIFESDSLGAVIDELLQYQGKIIDVNVSNYNKYTDGLNVIITKYMSLNDEEISTKIDRITSILSTNTRYTETDIKTMLSIDGLTNIDNYYNELEKVFSSNLEIGGVPLEDEENEKKFRVNLVNNRKYSNIVHIHTSYIRYIINMMSYISNSKDTVESTNKFERTFNLNFLPKDDREFANNILNSNKQLQIATTNMESFLLEDQLKKINNFLDNLTLYNNFINSDGSIKSIFVNNPKSLLILTVSIIVYLIDLIIDEGTELECDTSCKNLLIHLFEYLLYISDVNDITDDNIASTIKKYRADENLNRLKRFNKKSDELQNTHKIKRKFNLGYLEDDDDDIEMEEVNFMSTDIDIAAEQVENEAQLDNMDFSTNEPTWQADDAGMYDFIEEREEHE